VASDMRRSSPPVSDESTAPLKAALLLGEDGYVSRLAQLHQDASVEAHHQGIAAPRVQGNPRFREIEQLSLALSEAEQRGAPQEELDKQRANIEALYKTREPVQYVVVQPPWRGLVHDAVLELQQAALTGDALVAESLAATPCWEAMLAAALANSMAVKERDCRFRQMLPDNLRASLMTPPDSPTVPTLLATEECLQPVAVPPGDLTPHVNAKQGGKSRLAQMDSP